MNDLITVIINVYNGEKFIDKCLQCVINQTYKNIEILVVNDGSTDNTLKICEGYSDKRIRIITTENGGLSFSRNVGIENAKGEYLYFVDCDDFIANDVIEYLYNLCKKYDVKFSTCLSQMVDNYNLEVKQPEEKVEIISSKEMLTKILLAKDNSITTWNKLIKKEIYDGIRFNNKYINDNDVTHRLVINTDKIAYSNQKKYYYFKNPEGITAHALKNTPRSINLYKVAVERYKYIKKYYPDFIENEICLLRQIIKLYLRDDEELQKFLEEQNAERYIKELFSYKMLLKKMNIKIKLLFLMFRINPRFCRYINKKYQRRKYKYYNQ